ncbi:MAG: restriction endonuclease subunit S [Candidatus Saccharimonas sp.]
MKTVKLGDIIKLEYGKPLPSTQRHVGGKYPAYGANGVKARTDQYFYGQPSIIVGRKGSAGEITLTDGKFWPLDVTYFVTHDKNETDLLYIYHLFKRLNLPLLARGVKPGINRNDIYAIKVELPSLKEQQQIVARLDTAFEKISQAEVLMRQNLNNVAALQKSILHKYLSASDSTHTHRLGDLLIIERGGSPRPIKEYLTNAACGINWIKIGDVSPAAKYIESTKEKIKPDGLRRSRKVEVGDFVLSNSMSFGRPYIMKISGAIHDGWLLLRQKDKTLDKDFLYYFLSSDQAYSQFDRLAAGSTVRNLNTRTVAKVEIHYPKDIEEQRAIAKRLDITFEKIDQTRELYNEKLRKLTNLRQSLLQEAFSTTNAV